MEPLWVPLVPFACSPLHVCPCEERTFMLFVAAFWELENYDEIPLSLLFSRVKRPNSLSLSPQSRFSSSLIIFVALLWALSNVSMPFLNGAYQEWAPCCRCGLTSADQTGMIMTLISASYAPWMQFRIHFAFLAAAARCGLMLSCPPGLPGPFHQGSFSDRWILACPGNFGDTIPGP